MDDGNDDGVPQLRANIFYSNTSKKKAAQLRNQDLNIKRRKGAGRGKRQEDNIQQPIVKRKRGRKPKVKPEQKEPQVPKKRGRPRKQPPP